MKVHVEEVSPIERKLSIEVDQPRVARELDQAYASLGRQVKVAGFRPGKIPRRILEQRFREQVEDDVIRRVVERAYLDAVRDNKVEPVSHPQVTNEGLRPDAPFKFHARVQIKPKIQPKDYREILLKRVPGVVSDSEVADQLEKLRQGASRLEPVEGRELARSGDFAIVDYSATVDGGEFLGSRAENATIEVAPGELIHSKIPQLDGAKVGSTVELDYSFPQDFSVEEVKGKRAHFSVQVKGLKTKVVPDLNDEFAQEVRGGNTLEDLRSKIRADLEKAARTKADAEERDELIKALIERNPFEVPNAMVERAAEMMLDGGLRAMARGGIDPRRLNLDVGKLLEDMRPRALIEVKGALLFEAIAEQEGLTVSDEEIDKKLAEIAAESGQALAKVRKHFKDPAERSGLVQRLREEKTVEFLKAGAKYS